MRQDVAKGTYLRTTQDFLERLDDNHEYSGDDPDRRGGSWYRPTPGSVGLASRYDRQTHAFDQLLKRITDVSVVAGGS